MTHVQRAAMAKRFGTATDQYLDGRYREANPGWHVEDSPWKARLVCELLAQHGVTPERVGDVGCGVGEVLRLLHERFPTSQCIGFDVSPYALSQARTRQTDGLSFRSFDLDQSGDFDLALLLDVIEHVEDYFSLLRWVRSRARLQVLLIPLDLSALSVLRPHALVGARSSLGHIHYFVRATATRTLEDCGLRILYAQYVWPPTPRSSVKHHVLHFARLAVSTVSPDIAAKVLGGSSLLVLATSEAGEHQPRSRVCAGYVDRDPRDQRFPFGIRGGVSS
jgi:SAM-dependent methyltransferase